MVCQPYTGREVELLALDHTSLLGDDYDLATLLEVIEYRRKKELGDLLLLAQLVACATWEPSKLPSVDDLLYTQSEEESISRAEFEARLSRMN